MTRGWTKRESRDFSGAWERKRQIVADVEAFAPRYERLCREIDQRLTDEDCRRWAIHEIASDVRAQWRGKTRAAEEAAERQAREAALEVRRASPEHKARQRQMADEHEAAMAEIDRKFREGMQSALDQFRRHVIIEWTEELLDSGFALPDGTSTTWGDATAEQHQARADAMMRHATGEMASASRHLKAIDELKSNGAKCLRELVAEVAA